MPRQLTRLICRLPHRATRRGKCPRGHTPCPRSSGSAVLAVFNRQRLFVGYRVMTGLLCCPHLKAVSRGRSGTNAPAHPRALFVGYRVVSGLLCCPLLQAVSRAWRGRCPRPPRGFLSAGALCYAAGEKFLPLMLRGHNPHYEVFA